MAKKAVITAIELKEERDRASNLQGVNVLSMEIELDLLKKSNQFYSKYANQLECAFYNAREDLTKNPGPEQIEQLISSIDAVEARISAKDKFLSELEYEKEEKLGNLRKVETEKSLNDIYED